MYCVQVSVNFDTAKVILFLEKQISRQKNV